MALINAKIRSLGAAVEQVERAGIRQPWWERSLTIVLLTGMVSVTVLAGFLASAFSQAWLAERTFANTAELENIRLQEQRIRDESRFFREEISQLRRDAMNDDLKPSTRAETLRYLIGTAGDEDKKWAGDLLIRIRKEQDRGRLVDVIRKVLSYREKCDSASPSSACRLNLAGNDLSRLYMPEADFERANLMYANLDGADVRRGRFRGADLKKASLSEAILVVTKKFSR